VRKLLVALGVLVGLVLGAVQVLSSLALRDDAQPGSWVRLVPEAFAARVERLDPRLPLPRPLRIVLARDAFAAGDTAQAERQAGALPPSRDRTELFALIAEHRGDNAAAVRGFLDAGDASDLEHRIMEEQSAGRLDAAIGLQNATIERLRSDPSTSSWLPEAYYHLGLLQQAQAYRLPIDRRKPDEEQSLAAYESAIALAPLAERYLVAAGNQELNLRDYDAAERYFRRASDVDPTSVDAITGLGDLAYRRGQVAQARAALATARKMNAGAPSVRRLAAELGSLQH
jgi:tetratricopeptide (TPR) repeat protein